MEAVDFKKRERGAGLGPIFPDWREGERVAFYSPHDDDAALGAGYLLQAVSQNGGTPYLLVFCRGDAGYTTVEAKSTIVEVRRAETRRAYMALGVPEDRIIEFNVPDFALAGTLVRTPGPPGTGVFDRLVAFLRSREISRVVFTSGHDEHADHTAAYRHALDTTPQAGDPILADLGAPSPVRSFLAYGVWADFAPAAAPGEPAADKGLLASDREEQAVRSALAAFASQGDILSRTVAARREERRTDSGWLELYRTVDLRRPVDYGPYRDILKLCRKV